MEFGKIIQIAPMVMPTGDASNMDSIEFLVALTDTGKILYSNIRWINTNPCLVDWQEMSLLSPPKAA